MSGVFSTCGSRRPKVLFEQYCGCANGNEQEFAQGQGAMNVFVLPGGCAGGAGCRPLSSAGLGVARSWVTRYGGGNSLDGRHFGLIATNFEHHARNIFSPVGIIGGPGMVWLVICAVALAVSVGVCATAVIIQPNQSRSQPEV